jgi:hypothetical protein
VHYTISVLLTTVGMLPSLITAINTSNNPMAVSSSVANLTFTAIAWGGLDGEGIVCPCTGHYSNSDANFSYCCYSRRLLCPSDCGRPSLKRGPKVPPVETRVNSYDTLAPVGLPILIILCAVLVCSHVYKAKKSATVAPNEDGAVLMHEEALKSLGAGAKRVGLTSKSEGGFINDQVYSGMERGLHVGSRAVDGVTNVAVGAIDAGLAAKRMATKTTAKVGSAALGAVLTVGNAVTPVLDKASGAAMKGARTVGGMAIEGTLAAGSAAITGASKLGVATKARSWAAKMQFGRRKKVDSVAADMRRVQFVGWAAWQCDPTADALSAMDAACETAVAAVMPTLLQPHEHLAGQPRAATGDEYSSGRIIGLPVRLEGTSAMALRSPGNMGQTANTSPGVGRQVLRRVDVGALLDGTWSPNDGLNQSFEYMVAAVCDMLPDLEPEPEPELAMGSQPAPAPAGTKRGKGLFSRKRNAVADSGPSGEPGTPPPGAPPGPVVQQPLPPPGAGGPRRAPGYPVQEQGDFPQQGGYPPT